jgi:cytochrome c553
VKGRCLAFALGATLATAPAVGQPASAGYAERFAAGCAACHGAQGVSVLPLTPSLAGQPSFYAITQLFLFREGRRDNDAMLAVAKTLTDNDLRGFSDFIGKLPAPAVAPAAVGGDPRAARGAVLANRLRCTGCHGSDLAGGKQVPRLAGQREDYLLHALRGFRAGTRIGYSAAMSEALAGTVPDELEDLAYYLANFTAPRAP